MTIDSGQTRYSASVVGCGSGGRLSLNALHESRRFDLVAAADQRAEVREAIAREFPGIRTFATHQEMFEQSPTEVVCVSTYPPTHEEITLDALRELPLRGILVEKPLGHTAASGRNLFAQIKSRNLPMAVPHGMLALRTPTRIIELVHDGGIGDLKLVEIQNVKWDIINAGIHWINFFVRATGNEPIDHVLAQVDKTTRTYRDGMQVETIAVTSVQTRGGVRAIMHTGDDIIVNAPGKETVFRLVGSKGLIEFYGWEKGFVYNGDWIVPDEFETTGHRRHLDNLAAAIDRGEPNYSVAESSLAALEICEAAYLSARCGCRVTFPMTEFTEPLANDWAPGQPYNGVGGGRDGRNL